MKFQEHKCVKNGNENRSYVNTKNKCLGQISYLKKVKQNDDDEKKKNKIK